MFLPVGQALTPLYVHRVLGRNDKHSRPQRWGGQAARLPRRQGLWLPFLPCCLSVSQKLETERLPWARNSAQTLLTVRPRRPLDHSPPQVFHVSLENTALSSSPLKCHSPGGPGHFKDSESEGTNSRERPGNSSYNSFARGGQKVYQS